MAKTANIKAMSKSVKVLGVRVDKVTFESVLARLFEEAVRFGKFFVVTPNPEIVVRASRDRSFREALNLANLSVADGVGLRLVAGAPERVSGVDIVEQVLVESKQIKVVFFGIDKADFG